MALLSASILFSSWPCNAETTGSLTTMSGDIYDYDENNPPEVFFFPADKARWDGNSVTMKEWYTLTKLQKERFINEYVGELKKQYNGAIEVMGLDYLRALNLFSYYSNDNVTNEPSTKFVDKLLEAQGKIPSKGALFQPGPDAKKGEY